MRVAGVDGTKGGWVAIELDQARVASAYLIRPVESGFDELASASVIAVDVPIGYGPRKADAAARAFLSGAASTVFTTPPREVLEAPFGPGLGVSAQAHALGPRIIHVTRLATIDPRIHEVHPEVSFRAVGAPFAHRKKSAGGAARTDRASSSPRDRTQGAWRGRLRAARRRPRCGRCSLERRSDRSGHRANASRSA